MKDGVFGSIYIALGLYYFLVANGFIEGSRDPQAMADFRAKWGLIWAILSLLMIVGGLVQIFVL